MSEIIQRNRLKPGAGRNRAPRSFSSSEEAKDFLIGWIAAEARGLGVQLSDVERKMLYASKNGWTPVNMDEVQDAFDRYHEAVEYELKMTNLIRMVHIDAQTARPEELRDWNEAVRYLSEEDHYLLELIAAAEGPRRREASVWRLVLTAAVIIVVSVAVAYWFARR